MESVKILLEQIEESYSENDVTALCLCMLELANKTFRNGYKIITQANTLDLIPDIVIKILHNNEPLIVIECKGGNANAKKHYQKSLDQINSYLERLHYPYGFLVFPNKTVFLTRINGVKTEWGNSLEDIEDVIQTIKDL